MTIAISTSGDAPALTALLREGAGRGAAADSSAWMDEARDERVEWRREGVPMEQRKPLLLRALNALYHADASHGRVRCGEGFALRLGRLGSGGPG